MILEIMEKNEKKFLYSMNIVIDLQHDKVD